MCHSCARCPCWTTQGRIVASSNPANVGVTVATQNYLPADAGRLQILRIGEPWAGRDFASGQPSTAGTPVDADSLGFIPVTRSIGLGKGRVTLLFALNPDYFINHIAQKIAAEEGSVERAALRRHAADG
jgi:hypothetical protein